MSHTTNSTLVYNGGSIIDNGAGLDSRYRDLHLIPLRIKGFSIVAISTAFVSRARGLDEELYIFVPL